MILRHKAFINKKNMECESNNGTSAANQVSNELGVYPLPELVCQPPLPLSLFTVPVPPPPPPSSPYPAPLSPNVAFSCRDFARGNCTRTNCKFSHNFDVTFKETTEFCHDFQNKGCSRQNCKFLHCTNEEEAKFHLTQQLPQTAIDMYLFNRRICPDDANGECKKGSACTLRHPSKEVDIVNPLEVVPCMSVPPPPIYQKPVRAKVTSFTRAVKDGSSHSAPVLIQSQPPPPPPVNINSTIFNFESQKSDAESSYGKKARTDMIDNTPFITPSVNCEHCASCSLLREKVIELECTTNIFKKKLLVYEQQIHNICESVSNLWKLANHLKTKPPTFDLLSNVDKSMYSNLQEHDPASVLNLLSNTIISSNQAENTNNNAIANIASIAQLLKGAENFNFPNPATGLYPGQQPSNNQQSTSRSSTSNPVQQMFSDRQNAANQQQLPASNANPIPSMQRPYSVAPVFSQHQLAANQDNTQRHMLSNNDIQMTAANYMKGQDRLQMMNSNDLTQHFMQTTAQHFMSNNQQMGQNPSQQSQQQSSNNQNLYMQFR